MIANPTTFPFATLARDQIVAKLTSARAVVAGYEDGSRAPYLNDAQRAELLKRANGFVAYWERQLSRTSPSANADEGA